MQIVIRSTNIQKIMIRMNYIKNTFSGYFIHECINLGNDYRKNTFDGYFIYECIVLGDNYRKKYTKIIKNILLICFFGK